MKERISYEELELLVNLYQDGSPDASERLIELYEGYFQKFVNVLSHYKFNIDDKTQRTFVRTFIRDPEIKQLKTSYKRSPYKRRVYYFTAQSLYYGLNHLTADDLKHEMICLFLEMASRHNGKAGFGLYIARFFPLQLHRIVMGLMVEADERKVEIPYDDEMPETAVYDTYDLDEWDVPFFYIEQMTPTEFDENWVNGYLAKGLFAYLTVYERRLLKWYYEWKTLDAKQLPADIYSERKDRLRKTESEIADLLGCSRKTINLKRNEIKRELAELATNIHLIKQ